MAVYEDRPLPELNTTPLIDVMLVLLVMFIITLPIMTHAVKLDLPRNTPLAAPPDRPEGVDLEIDFDGTLVWNGSVVTEPRALDSYFHQEARKSPQPEIHIRANGRAKYGIVAQVLASAQRNRLQKIGFVNTSDFAR